MPDFETGISNYVHATATVEVFFPVDKRGCADVSCNQCYYFRRNYRSCGLNGEICAYPEKYVGASCPLKIYKGDTEDEEDQQL